MLGAPLELLSGLDATLPHGFRGLSRPSRGERQAVIPLKTCDIAKIGDIPAQPPDAVLEAQHCVVDVLQCDFARKLQAEREQLESTRHGLPRAKLKNHMFRMSDFADAMEGRLTRGCCCQPWLSR